MKGAVLPENGLRNLCFARFLYFATLSVFSGSLHHTTFLKARLQRHIGFSTEFRPENSFPNVAQRQVVFLFFYVLINSV